jgi:hypothetical protein
MKQEQDRGGPERGVPVVAAARDRLDDAILGFNRQSILAERYRLAVARFRGSKVAFESSATEYEQWREARAVAAAHRADVRVSIRDYVHRLRSEGIAPEQVVVAVKQRLLFAVSRECPDAPRFDADALAADATTWTIEAYYEVA